MASGCREGQAELAGVLAIAVQHAETDAADVRCAVRVLSENLHAAVALWRQWRELEEPGEAAEARRNARVRALAAGESELWHLRKMPFLREKNDAARRLDACAAPG